MCVCTLYLCVQTDTCSISLFVSPLPVFLSLSLILYFLLSFSLSPFPTVLVFALSGPLHLRLHLPIVMQRRFFRFWAGCAFFCFFRFFCLVFFAQLNKKQLDLCCGTLCCASRYPAVLTFHSNCNFLSKNLNRINKTRK